MKNIPFVKEDEILIILCEDEINDTYDGPLEREEVIELVENKYDDVVRLLRLDLRSLHADDVSEQIAELYMNMKIRDGYDQDEQVAPFIFNSDAYHAYLDQKIAQEYEDNLYGSYEKQHRLRWSDVLNEY
ncbi:MULTISPECIES: hypothetical protein [unclassified Bartonella]|uniref:hypothetical protein n=1 Tax=Bartonella TaxID=773 RepID=UPI00099B1D49|nr:MULTISPECIES: hypothetical protein [unclassified Bartonella]AQX18871.1 hypothetical protein BA1379B_010690 [Bartonella sp. A1379B]AQX22094.1 hypothetical protein Bho11B_000620 [Bartonella sp. 11B]AQX24626.1 hypothetical protein Bho114_013170 [Bartonella sp. 114]AQX25862.1 hypothetical protein Bco22_012170 [Bartonella sp. Coyote22sub2]